LPLSKQTQNIALIGPFVKAVRDNLGFWSYSWPDDTARIVTLWNGVQQKLNGNAKLLYAKGCNINDDKKDGFEEAVAIAKQADVVILSVGEAPDMTGEAKSRSNLHLPGVQEELIKTIMATGKPLIVLISAGRPLVFNWTADNVPAIIYTWWLGTQAGNAIADVLFGDYNPSGKLPISFPRTEGQVPIYYNHYATGRPARNDSDVNYVSAYTDLLNSPKYSFGHGLSYTKFEYGKIKLSKTKLHAADKLEATVVVTNAGNYDGEEVVQLYIRDMFGSVVRPIKELKGFQKIFLKKGENREVKFTLSVNDLRFYDDKLNYNWEPGAFQIMIGGSSNSVQTAAIEWNR
jgi:beta-glucosidase